MKKITTIIMALTASAVVVFAQGTVNFANVGAGFNQPIRLNGVSTGIPTGYTVDLFSGANAGSLAFIGSQASAGNGFFTGGTRVFKCCGWRHCNDSNRAWLTSAGSFANAQALGATLANQWESLQSLRLFPPVLPDRRRRLLRSC